MAGDRQPGGLLGGPVTDVLRAVRVEGGPEEGDHAAGVLRGVGVRPVAAHVGETIEIAPLEGVGRAGLDKGATATTVRGEQGTAQIQRLALEGHLGLEELTGGQPDESRPAVDRDASDHLLQQSGRVSGSRSPGGRWADVDPGRVPGATLPVLVTQDLVGHLDGAAVHPGGAQKPLGDAHVRGGQGLGALDQAGSGQMEEHLSRRLAHPSGAVRDGHLQQRQVRLPQAGGQRLDDPLAGLGPLLLP